MTLVLARTCSCRRGCERDGSPGRARIAGTVQPATVRAGVQDLRVFRRHCERSDIQSRQSLIYSLPSFSTVITLPNAGRSADVENQWVGGMDDDAADEMIRER